MLWEGPYELTLQGAGTTTTTTMNNLTYSAETCIYMYYVYLSFLMLYETVLNYAGQGIFSIKTCITHPTPFIQMIKHTSS